MPKIRVVFHHLKDLDPLKVIKGKGKTRIYVYIQLLNF